VISFQTACWDDPEELFGSQGFGLSVDPKSQVAVLFADAERKYLLQIEEAADDILPLFVVNRFNVAPVMLRFFDFSVWIVKQDFSRREEVIFGSAKWRVLLIMRLMGFTLRKGLRSRNCGWGCRPEMFPGCERSLRII